MEKSMRIRVSKDFEIHAEDKQAGIQQVRDKFEKGEMTYRDLAFTVEAIEEDPEPAEQ